MKDMLMKMSGKKDKKLSPMEQEAKMSVLGHLKSMADDSMMGKLKGLKKVSVMSDSKEGLESGLDKAKDVVEGPEMHDMESQAKEMDASKPEMGSLAEEQAEDEMGEESEKMPELMADMEHMSEEELDAAMAHLMALKEKKQLLK